MDDKLLLSRGRHLSLCVVNANRRLWKRGWGKNNGMSNCVSTHTMTKKKKNQILETTACLERCAEEILNYGENSLLVIRKEITDIKTVILFLLKICLRHNNKVYVYSAVAEHQPSSRFFYIHTNRHTSSHLFKECIKFTFMHEHALVHYSNLRV